MSSFDRAAIERHLEDLDRYEPLAAARNLLRGCLDEIDRLASAEYEAEVVQQLRVAVDVLLTKIDRLTQRVERADVQVRNPPARFIPVPEYEGEETIQKQPWWRRLKTWRTGWS